MNKSNFAKVALEIYNSASTEKFAASTTKDADWQRVNSYIADILKDSMVLYSKLSRLQADFMGEELDRLMHVSEAVLAIGEQLSAFSKAFYEGKLKMVDSEFSYGGSGGGSGNSGGGTPAQQPQQPPQPHASTPDSELFQPFGNTGEPPSKGEEGPSEGEDESPDSGKEEPSEEKEESSEEDYDASEEEESKKSK